MLCCDTGGDEPRDLEDLAAFVSQLAALGHAPRIHVRSVPEGLSRNAQFDLAPYLFDGELGKDDRLLIVAAQRVTERRLLSLRAVAGPAGPRCLAFGTFDSRQSEIGTRARLSYAVGHDPQMIDIAAGGPLRADAHTGCPVFGVARRSEPASPIRLLLVAPELADPHQAAALGALALSRLFRVLVLTDGVAKHDWTKARGNEIPVFHYGEVLPCALAERVDVCACFTAPGTNYRLQSLLANLAVSGVPLVDATPRHVLEGAADAFVRGPGDLVGLAPFLETGILANYEEVARHVRASATARGLAPDAVEALLDARAVPAASRRAVEEGPPRVVFVPTNGVGLGHAKRCSMIAQELDGAQADPVFAAFPSCTRLIKSFGFDVAPLIGRSAHHAQSFENDLPNYLRLRALTEGARTLVFDGGYIFNSVYRSIIENRLRAIWIRRGLWQRTQNNAIALDREKAFERVIVPREAFDEINTAYSRGEHLVEVGPIVQRADLSPDAMRRLRDNLATRFGVGFDRLVVTLLGAGVAADRGAQIQTLCGIMERRPDTLHLIVVWPTATQQPGWFGWSRSRVVRTQHAHILAAAADLCVSAAGYNTFHEVLYNRVPTIFIPQMGPFMDDQRARARAAGDRGLATALEPEELLRLGREIDRYLDGGEGAAVRRRLAELELPAPGNARAARLIEEVANGAARPDCAPVADRSAGARGHR